MRVMADGQRQLMENSKATTGVEQQLPTESGGERGGVGRTHGDARSRLVAGKSVQRERGGGGRKRGRAGHGEPTVHEDGAELSGGEEPSVAEDAECVPSSPVKRRGAIMGVTIEEDESGGDDEPDVIGYLDQWGIGRVGKIAILRTSANKLASIDRALNKRGKE